MARFASSRVRSLPPFGIVALLGLVLVAVPSDATRWGEFAASAGLTLLAGALALVPGGRVPAFLRTAPALVYVIAVALLRDALGGVAGGVGMLVLLPVIWTALHGTRRQLVVVIGAIALTWIYPIIVVGGTSYPSQGWRSVFLLVLVSAVLGDALLRGSAARWQAELGPLDLLARLGGDEFGVVMPTRDLDAAIALVERLRDAVPGAETCSAGVAESRVGESSGSLLERADAALYAAKRAGGDLTFAGPSPVRGRPVALSR
jgi:hypothetical protein